MKIIICPDSSAGVGIGHLKRCEAIFEALKDKHDVEYLPTNYKNQTKLALKKSLVLLDTHLPIHSLISDLKREQNKVVVLDNFNDDQRDLGINIFDHHPVDRNKTSTSIDYIILRKEIFSYCPSSVAGDYALVTIGGGDQLGLGKQIVENLRKFYDKKILFIQGPQAKAVDMIVENTETLHNPPNFLELMARADLVLCNAGSTLFEALILKKRCLVFPQTPYEVNIANYFDKNGYLLGVGIDNIAAGLEKMNDLQIGVLPYTGKGAEVIGKFIKELL